MEIFLREYFKYFEIINNIIDNDIVCHISRDIWFGVIFICNEQMMAIINKVLMAYLKDFQTDGALFYSKVNGGSYYKVGASFNSYEFNGKQVAA